MDIHIILKNLCFNCGEEISSERLEKGLPCEKDIKNEDLNKIKEETKLDDIYNILKEKNRLFKFEEIYNLRKEAEKFSKFFYEALNSDPWSLQISWFKRLLRKESFSIIAPTGTGKSTFIILASLYLENKKIGIILPTTLLVRQFYERLNQFASKMNINKKIVAYLKEFKKDTKEKIKNGDFDILIISNNFLAKNFDILKDKKFDIIFVDDVDAFFKGSKNIERVFLLLGFTEEDINIAKKVIDLKLSGKFDINSDIAKKLEEIRNKDHGILILSSATGSVRGKRTRLYKELLRFSVGTGSSKIRNIIDIYLKFENVEENLEKLVSYLKDGILIFISLEYGQEYAKKLYEYLKGKGYSVELVISGMKDNHEKIKKFAEGAINCLIGMAHPYGILVRGLDLPARTKYAIFVGIPKIKINITKLERNIGNMLILGNLIKDLLDEEEKRKLNILINKIERNIKRLSMESLRLLNEAYNEKKELQGWLNEILKDINLLDEKVRNYLSNEEFVKKLEHHPSASIKYEEGNVYLQIVDIKTYIQASGRVSRLYAGGITKGLSFVFVDDEKLLNILDRRLKLMFY